MLSNRRGSDKKGRTALYDKNIIRNADVLVPICIFYILYWCYVFINLSYPNMLLTPTYA